MKIEKQCIACDKLFVIDEDWYHDECPDCAEFAEQWQEPEDAHIPNVILLVGAKGAGKNLAADYLTEMLVAKRYKVEQQSFANKLKNVCSEVFGFKREFCEDLKLKELQFRDLGFEPHRIDHEKFIRIIKAFGLVEEMNNMDDGECRELLDISYVTRFKSIRHILQYVGTEILRKVSNNADVHVENTPITADNITIITDCRFQNEFYYMMNNYNCLPIYIRRPSAEEILDNHVSEQEFKLFRDRCITINNHMEDKNALKDMLYQLLRDEDII